MCRYMDDKDVTRKNMLINRVRKLGKESIVMRIQYIEGRYLWWMRNADKQTNIN